MPIYRRRPTVQPIASINLTSLLDVTFVLLLSFMIVAPTLKSGLTLDLPKVEESETLTPKRKNFTIVLKKPNRPGLAVRIYLDEERLDDFKHLRRKLEDLHRRYSPDLDILVEADRLIPCETLLKVLAVTKDVGIDSIGVVTEPEEKKK